MVESPCGCKLQCYQNIPLEQRTKLFDGFWASGSYNVQNAYICGCVKITKVARRYTSQGDKSRRSFSRSYYVTNYDVSTRVCKKAFLQIHGLSNGRLSHALEAQRNEGGTPALDKRGKHEPRNKTSKDKLDFVKVHINSFPQYKSHYSRSDNPNKLYLSPDLNIDKMYRLYKQRCEEESKPPVSSWVYRKTFNECFNLSFGT